MTLKQSSEGKLGIPARYHRGAKETDGKGGVRAPLFPSGGWLEPSGWPKRDAPLASSICYVVTGGLAFPACPGPLDRAGGWEEKGAVALALPLPSLPPLLPFLSCLLLWPEEMEWAEGGPMSSHPLPEPKSGATLPPPEPGREEGCAAGEVAGTTARNQDPPPSSQGP